MKIAFLGKGGSGKSTMATAFVKELRSKNMNVLAIDADHNVEIDGGHNWNKNTEDEMNRHMSGMLKSR